MNSPWPKVRLDAVGEIQAGRQRSASIVTGTPRHYLRVANVFDGFIDYHDVLQMPFRDSEFETYVLKPGDILLNEGQSLQLVGRSAIYQGPENTYCFQNTLIRFRPSEAIDTQYARFAFQRMLITGVFASIASRTTSIAHLGVERFASLPIPLPPLEEQRAISAVLTVWDRGIRQVSDMIAGKLRFKQGLMLQLLAGKRRITSRLIGQRPGMTTDAVIRLGLSATAVAVERGLQGKSYDEGIPKLDARPYGWKTRRLAELLFPIERPVALQPQETYQLVTAKRYRAGIVAREELRGNQIKTSTQFETKEGDFLISRRQIVHGACGLVPKHLDGAIVSNEYSCLRMSDDLDPLFFEYVTHTKYMQRTFYQSSVGVAVEKMIFRIDNWLDYTIHLPPIAEQRRIVFTLAAIDREIILLDHWQKMVTQQKKALMQRLLTGQVRMKL